MRLPPEDLVLGPCRAAECEYCAEALARGDFSHLVPEIRYETTDALDLDPESYWALLLLRGRWLGLDRPNVLIRGFD